MNYKPYSPINLSQAVKGSGFSRTAPNRFFYFQDQEDIPIVPVPDRLHFKAEGVEAIFWKEQSPFVSPMGDVISSKPLKISIPCPLAEPILTEYIKEVFPLKNTIKWMEYAREKSKSQTGSSEEQTIN